jgi:hypothetical protein
MLALISFPYSQTAFMNIPAFAIFTLFHIKSFQRSICNAKFRVTTELASDGILDELKEKRRYWKLKEEALDRTMWRTRFRRNYGPVVRQTAERYDGTCDYHK